MKNKTVGKVINELLKATQFIGLMNTVELDFNIKSTSESDTVYNVACTTVNVLVSCYRCKINGSCIGFKKRKVKINEMSAKCRGSWVAITCVPSLTRRIPSVSLMAYVIPRCTDV